jgi:hypothetical protein
MLNWIRRHAVGLLRASFCFGAFCAAAFAIDSHFPQTKLLSIGVLVCACAVLITLISRITVWCSKKFMAEPIAAIRWFDLTADQFHTLGAPVRIAFFTGLVGLFAAAFGFGWLLATMIFVIFRGN